ncbi:MAG: hypothetical protein J0M10_06645 [Chitinophagales bacterium]|nr:hypothetical protein [Chitinophagales bacterium]
MKILYYLSFFCLLTANCNTSTTNTDNKIIVQKKDNQDIDGLNNENDKISFLRYKIAKLHLDTIQNGFDSIQLRIWILGGLFGNVDLYILKNVKSKWTAQNYKLFLDSNIVNGKDQNKYTNGSEPFQIVKHRLLKPIIPWSIFIDSLSKLQIMTLPDMDEITGMKINSTDAGSIVVEVATRQFYRNYHYSDPVEFAERYTEAKNINYIVSLILTTLK